MSKRNRKRDRAPQRSETQAVEPEVETAVAESEVAAVAKQPEPTLPAGPQFDPDFDLELDIDEDDSPQAERLRKSLAFDDPLEAEPIPIRQFEVFDGSPGPTTMKWKREAERKAAAKKAETEDRK